MKHLPTRHSGQLALLLALAASAIAPRAAHAVDPDDLTLLSDVEPGRLGSSVEWGASLPGCQLFSALREGYGRELHCTDGHTTHFVRDLAPGEQSGVSPGRMATLNGFAYFAGMDAGLGYELWRTDGTYAGTTRVREIHPGPLGSNPRSFVVTSRFVYFVANDGTNGDELWRTDGTSAGTVLMANIAPSGQNSNPVFEQSWVMHDTLFFTAYSPTQGRELWSTVNVDAPQVFSNGDLNPGAASAFGSDSRLGVVRGSRFYFRANDGTHGEELFFTNGSRTGTMILKDVNDAGASSSPADFVASEDYVYFSAAREDVGRELFRTDGTPEGTVVIDVAPGATSTSPSDLTLHAHALFFTADRASGGRALFRIEEPSLAATLVNPSTSGPGYFGLGGITQAHGQLFFYNGRADTGIELWRSDGTDAGTRLYRDIVPGAASSDPSELVALQGALLFVADDGTHGEEPFSLRYVPTLAWLVGDRPGEERYEPAQQHNAAGLRNSIWRADAGIYFVLMYGVGRAGGNVQVATRSGTSNVCKSAGFMYSESEDAELAIIVCEDASGEPADAPFEASFFDAKGYPGRGAYLVADQTSTPAYWPSATYAWSSSGIPPRILRSDVGIYDVRLQGQDVGGNMQVTVMGADAHQCAVVSDTVVGTEKSAVVVCRDRAGVPVDSMFSLRFSRDDLPGAHGAYARLRNASTPTYLPSARDRFNSTGAINKFRRTDVGAYSAYLPGLSGTEGVVNVTPGASTTNRCEVVDTWNESTSKVVAVQCINAAGVAADTPFYLEYLATSP